MDRLGTFIYLITISYMYIFTNYKFQLITYTYLISTGIKFLPISLDAGIYAYLTNNNLGPTVLLSDIPGRDSVASEASGFGG